MQRGLGFGVSDSLWKGLLSCIVRALGWQYLLGSFLIKNSEVAGGVFSIIPLVAGVSTGLELSADVRQKTEK